MAKVRVDWVRLARTDYERGEGANDLADSFGSETIPVAGTAASSGAAPNFGGDGQGFARVSVLSGAVNLAWGSAPVASETAGVRLEAGATLLIAIATGQRLSAIEAADAPAVREVRTRLIQGEPVSRSGALASGGVAQDLMAANAARQGWRLQNQSDGDLYVGSKGVAGTTAATLDAACLRIPPGALWTEDGPVTPNALSIIGATAGQAFHAREW